MYRVEEQPVITSVRRDRYTNVRPILKRLGMDTRVRDIVSDSFVSGSSGWRIAANGDAEFNNGRFRGNFQIGGTLITVSNFTDLPDAISEVESAGGGTISLVPNEYSGTADITIPSGVTFDGNGSLIDFGGGSFGIKIEGANVYNTGTISATYGSSTITGSGTTWTSGMVGQSILIGDYWYPIATFNSATSIDLAYPFIGTDLTGDTYVIADTVQSVNLKNLVLANSSTSLVRGQYINGSFMDNVATSGADIGFDFKDCGSVFGQNVFADSCATWGMKFDNCPFLTWQLYSVTSGAGVYARRVTNTGMSVCSFQDITTAGMSFTDCFNIGFVNYSIIQGASHGIEFISGNSDIDIGVGYINTCGGDGIRVGSSNDLNISNNSIKNTGGYQVNVGVGSNKITIGAANNLDGSGLGAVNDLGTDTLIRSNQGVADN